MHLLLAALPAAISACGPLTVHIIGDGVERKQLQDLARNLGVEGHVVFHGRVSDLRRDELLSTAWLTVNPTAGEGWGLSVLEANRVGVPALAFNVDGVRDSVIDGVTGWLVARGGEIGPGLVEALLALRDERTARQFESASKAWASAFTWDATATGILNLLNEERQRLARPTDRRLHSDLTTVVDIDAEHLPAEWDPPLRSGDAIVREADRVRILLHSAGHAEVLALLHRCGVNPKVMQEGLYNVAVAGQHDALLLAAGASDASLRCTTVSDASALDHFGKTL